MPEFSIDTIYCAHIRRGDIILRLNEKTQEEDFLLVVQDNALNESIATILCFPVYPYYKGTYLHINDVLLPKEVSGLSSVGFVRTHDIHQVDRRHVVAKKGEIDAETLRSVYDAFDITLGRFRDVII